MEKIKIKAVEPISEHAIVVPEPKEEAPQAYKWAVLVALQSKHIYAGTVAPAEKARRRAANKVARKSRKNNR